MTAATASPRHIHIGASAGLANMPDQLAAIHRYLGYAERLGFDSIEVGLNVQRETSPFAPLPYPWEPSPVWSELRTLIAGFTVRGAHLPMLSVPLADAAAAGAVADRHRASMDRAAELGLHYLVIHALDKGLGRQRAVPRWVEFFGPLGEYAGGLGLQLCLENASHTFFLADAAAIVRQVDLPAFRMTLDVGHAMLEESRTTGLAGLTYQGYTDMDDFIRREHTILGTLHIHDNCAAGERDDHLVLGDGVGDFGFLRTLYELGYAGVWDFEHFLRDDWDSLDVAAGRLRALLGLPAAG